MAGVVDLVALSIGLQAIFGGIVAWATVQIMKANRTLARVEERRAAHELPALEVGVTGYSGRGYAGMANVLSFRVHNRGIQATSIRRAILVLPPESETRTWVLELVTPEGRPQGPVRIEGLASVQLHARLPGDATTIQAGLRLYLIVEPEQGSAGTAQVSGEALRRDGAALFVGRE